MIQPGLDPAALPVGQPFFTISTRGASGKRRELAHFRHRARLGRSSESSVRISEYRRATARAPDAGHAVGP
jgi:hypothetical protein